MQNFHVLGRPEEEYYIFGDRTVSLILKIILIKAKNIFSIVVFISIRVSVLQLFLIYIMFLFTFIFLYVNIFWERVVP